MTRQTLPALIICAALCVASSSAGAQISAPAPPPDFVADVQALPPVEQQVRCASVMGYAHAAAQVNEEAPPAVLQWMEMLTELHLEKAGDLYQGSVADVSEDDASAHVSILFVGDVLGYWGYMESNRETRGVDYLTEKMTSDMGFCIDLAGAG